MPFTFQRNSPRYDSHSFNMVQRFKMTRRYRRAWMTSTFVVFDLIKNIFKNPAPQMFQTSWLMIPGSPPGPSDFPVARKRIDVRDHLDGGWREVSHGLFTTNYERMSCGKKWFLSNSGGKWSVMICSYLVFFGSGSCFPCFSQGFNWFFWLVADLKLI